MSPKPPSKREFLEIVGEAVAADKDARAAAERNLRPLTRTPYLLEVLGVVLAAALLTAVLKPEWFVGAREAPPTPAVAEANTRAAMYVAVMQLHDFKSRHGQFPERLAELPLPSPRWLLYSRDAAGGFVLRAERANTDALTLTSADDARAFLGDSFDRLKDRGK